MAGTAFRLQGQISEQEINSTIQLYCTSCLQLDMATSAAVGYLLLRTHLRDVKH